MFKEEHIKFGQEFLARFSDGRCRIGGEVSLLTDVLSGVYSGGSFLLPFFQVEDLTQWRVGMTSILEFALFTGAWVVLMLLSEDHSLRATVLTHLVSGPLCTVLGLGGAVSLL